MRRNTHHEHAAPELSALSSPTSPTYVRNGHELAGDRGSSGTQERHQWEDRPHGDVAACSASELRLWWLSCRTVVSTILTQDQFAS